MQNSFLVLGTNAGEGIAYDFLKFANPARVTVADYDFDRAKSLERKLNDPRVNAICVDVSDSNLMYKTMKGYNLVASAVPYKFNLELTKVAIEAKTNFLDLGGNNDIVRAQCALDSNAKEAGVKIAPAWGAAPGADNVGAAYTIDQYILAAGDYPENVKIRVGGFPINPKGLFVYGKLFCMAGVGNEYIENVEILREFARYEVESLTGFEEDWHVGGFGPLEAVYTSGGSATLAETYAGKIRNLDYKTLRYPGHWEKMAFLKHMRMFSENSVDIFGKKIKPREFTEAVLEEAISECKEDVMLMYILAEGKEFESGLEMVYRHSDNDAGHTAMVATTGYPAAVAGKMLLDGSVKRNGTLYHERDFPLKEYLDRLEQRGIVFQEFSEWK